MKHIQEVPVGAFTNPARVTGAKSSLKFVWWDSLRAPESLGEQS